jgi:hypothetical protein
VGVESKNFSVFVAIPKSQVLISSAAPSPKQLLEMKTTVGTDKAVLRGVCSKALDGYLVFGVKGPVPPAAKAGITLAMKTAACPKWRIEELKDEDADAVDGEASVSDEEDEKPQPRQPRLGQVKGRIGEVQPNAGQGNQAGPTGATPRSAGSRPTSATSRAPGQGQPVHAKAAGSARCNVRQPGQAN